MRATMTVALAVTCLIVAACGVVPVLGPRVEIAAGLAHRMSIADVQRVVRTEVVADAAALGVELRPFRVTRIRLVAPFEVVRDSDSSDPAATGFSTDGTTWLVEAEGTFRDCGSTCASYDRGVVLIDDARGVIVGGYADGPATPSR